MDLTLTGGGGGGGGCHKKYKCMSINYIEFASNQKELSSTLITGLDTDLGGGGGV